MLTGDAGIDAVTRAGIAGLSRFMIEKTALEPGQPAGVDIAKDELSFYPLIYWPIDARAAMPSEAAIARVDAYMQSGGTVLFDTRDQFSTGISTPARQALPPSGCATSLAASTCRRSSRCQRTTC